MPFGGIEAAGREGVGGGADDEVEVCDDAALVVGGQVVVQAGGEDSIS